MNASLVVEPSTGESAGNRGADRNRRHRQRPCRPAAGSRGGGERDGVRVSQPSRGRTEGRTLPATASLVAHADQKPRRNVADRCAHRSTADSHAYGGLTSDLPRLSHHAERSPPLRRARPRCGLRTSALSGPGSASRHRPRDSDSRKHQHRRSPRMSRPPHPLSRSHAPGGSWGRLVFVTSQPPRISRPLNLAALRACAWTW